MNTITIELCKEDRARLDDLIAFAGIIVGDIKDRQIQTPAAPLEPSAAPAAAPVAEPSPVEPAPAQPEPEVKAVSFAEFQKAVTQVVAKGPKQKAAVKEIITKYAASVTEVPEDKRAEIIAALAEL